MSFSVTMGNVLCHLYDVMEMCRALMNQTKKTVHAYLMNSSAMTGSVFI